MASKFSESINYDPGPWYCGESEPDWDREIERLEAVNAQLVEIMKQTLDWHDHNKGTFPIIEIRAAIMAATES